MKWLAIAVEVETERRTRARGGRRGKGEEDSCNDRGPHGGPHARRCCGGSHPHTQPPRGRPVVRVGVARCFVSCLEACTRRRGKDEPTDVRAREKEVGPGRRWGGWQVGPVYTVVVAWRRPDVLGGVDRDARKVGWLPASSSVYEHYYHRVMIG
jgi:hypothetical protein